MLDLLQAIVHHVLVFGIFGILFAEFMALRPDMNNATVVRVASIDLWYGVFAVAIITARMPSVIGRRS
jgi:putative membrane protein